MLNTLLRLPGVVVGRIAEHGLLYASEMSDLGSANQERDWHESGMSGLEIAIQRWGLCEAGMSCLGIANSGMGLL